jgi:hypothetical protein
MEQTFPDMDKFVYSIDQGVENSKSRNSACLPKLDIF